MNNLLFTEKDFEKYIDIIAEQESQELRPPNEFISGVQEILKYGGRQSGEPLPWEELAEVWRLRPKEVTIWSGVNGHGKSLLLGQVMLWRMATQKVVIASLEMTPAQTLYRMCCQFAGCIPSNDFVEKIINSMSGRCWIYDQLDTVNTQRIRAMVEYCAKELKVDHIVIDSLLKCGIRKDDMDAQYQFVDKLQWAAKRNGVHIHIVMHPRKGESEFAMVGKMDVRGAGEMIDLADNIVFVSRNKYREHIIKKLKHEGRISPEEQDVIDNQKEAKIDIQKNRHGQIEDYLKLNFHHESMQYSTKEHQRMPSPWQL